MKTPEDFRTLWTERFAQNDLNGLYGTKCFENKTNTFGTERNLLRMKRNVLRTKRKCFGNGTKRFENRTLFKCSSALLDLYDSRTY